MRVYKDKFSGDEMFTDTYPMELLDGVVYKLKGKLTSEKVDIDDALIGANASAEGGDESAGVDPSSVSGVDIVLSNRLVEFGLKKKEYMQHIKEYMKNVKARLEEDESKEVDLFMSNVQKFVKDVIGNFKDYQLYCGESNHHEGMLGLLKWEEVDGAEVPFMYFFKHGLEEEKL